MWRRIASIVITGIFLGLVIWFGLSEWAHDKLHTAVEQNNRSKIRLLLTIGANLEARNEQGDTPLLAAVKMKNLDTVKLLLQAGANPNVSTHHGQSALHVAAFRSNEFIVRVLLDHGAKANSRDELGHTPLDCAVHTNHFSTALLLRRRGALVPENMKQDPMLLRSAIKHKNLAMIEWLVETGVDPNTVAGRNREPALHLAIRTRDLAAVQCLLDHGASVEIKNSSGMDAQEIAKTAGSLEIVRLLDPGFEFSQEALDTMFLTAVKKGRTKQAEDLVAAGASCNATDNIDQGALHLTSHHGSKDLMQFLHSHGTPVDTADKDGNTALHAHAAAGNISGVQQLLQMGANPNAVNNLGETAVVMAARVNEFEFLQEIIAALVVGGADINASSDEGISALHWAVRNGNLAVAEWMLDMGANIEIGINQCGTPLYWAVEQPLGIKGIDKYQVMQLRDRDFVSLIRLLLSRDADPHAPTDWHDTPALAAKRSSKLLIKEAVLGIAPESTVSVFNSPTTE